MFILASASPARRMVLKNAGLQFETDPADIDERAAEQPLADAGTSPEDLALALAMVKADTVSHRHPGTLTVGADQILDLDGKRLNKPVARDGESLWSHMETVSLTMRDLTPAEIGQYLASVGDIALSSVGAYQIEGPGIQLFDRIDGDYFAILGFPLLPFLTWMRQNGEARGFANGVRA